MIQKSPAMGIPMIIMYGTIFVSYIFVAITTVFKIIDILIEAKNSDTEEVEKV